MLQSWLMQEKLAPVSTNILFCDSRMNLVDSMIQPNINRDSCLMASCCEPDSSTILIPMKQRMMWWQWHQLDLTQIIWISL